MALLSAPGQATLQKRKCQPGRIPVVAGELCRPLLWKLPPAAHMALVTSCGHPSMQAQLCLLHQDSCCSSATPQVGHLQQIWQQTGHLLHHFSRMHHPGTLLVSSPIGRAPCWHLYLLHFSSMSVPSLQEKVARECLPSCCDAENALRSSRDGAGVSWCRERSCKAAPPTSARHWFDSMRHQQYAGSGSWQSPQTIFQQLNWASDSHHHSTFNPA